MTFSFDSADPQEAARAERVVKDMLARGYALFAKVDGKTVRVKKFDSKTKEYIIADGPEVAPKHQTEEPPESELKKPGKRAGYKTRGERRVPAGKTPVTGVAPTAGG